jgi:hypothetical protein
MTLFDPPYEFLLMTDKGKPQPPSSPNPWDRPPSASKGDVSDMITFAAVGRAITAWEEFEHNFAYLFSRFIGTNIDELVASRAYGAVLTFKGRSEMVEAAAEAFFFSIPVDTANAQIQDELKDEILGVPGNRHGKRKTTGFIDEAKLCSGRRNEIAHGIVRQLWKPYFVVLNTMPLNHPPDSWGFAVVPSAYATKNNKLKPPARTNGMVVREGDYRYTSTEIDIIADSFRSLRDRAARISIWLHTFAQHRGPTTFPETEV